MGDESLHRTMMNVPAIIVAYNLFMNGVDVVDQMRASQPMAREEQRVTMTMFFFLIDIAIQNAFSLSKVLNTGHCSNSSILSFKREVADCKTIHENEIGKKLSSPSDATYSRSFLIISYSSRK